MPLPLILFAGAAAAGSAGIFNAAKGTQKMVQSNKDKKEIDQKHTSNMEYYKEVFDETTKNMDTLGEYEFMVMSEFEEFSDLIERIKNRPEFGEIIPDGFGLPEYTIAELKDIAVGAVAVASGIGGVATGTFGGFAAAGATCAAVMALGTASTGTAIASLSGAAATNATLAALGGGAIAAGGGGMALGTTVLGATTLGVGLMVGGIIFNIAGNSIKGKIEEAREVVDKETEEVAKVCDYLLELNSASMNYLNTLSIVKKIYDKHFARLEYTVVVENKTDYREFTQIDKIAFQNTVLLVGILYDMLKVKIVEKVDEEHNKVNSEPMNACVLKAKDFLKKDPLVKAEVLDKVNDDVMTPIVIAKKEEAEEAEEAEQVEEENEAKKKESSVNLGEAAQKAGKGLATAATTVGKGVGKGAAFAAKKTAKAVGYAAGFTGTLVGNAVDKIKKGKEKE